VYGNTEMWSAAFIALALRWPVASWALAVKPSVLPLALLFARDRRWWVGPFVVAALAAPFGALWLDYAVALSNVEGSLLRSVNALPWLAIPLVAYFGSGVPRVTMYGAEETDTSS